MRKFVVRLGMLFKNQKGFTLIELLVVVALTGILSAGIASLIWQVGKVNDIDNSRVKAVNEVENAVHWMNRDVQMSQKVQVNGTGYLIKMNWVTWEDDQAVQVIYNLESGNLVRKYSVDGGAPAISTVAKNISSDSSKTSFSFNSTTRKVSIKITSSGTSGAKTAYETRTIEIFPRPGT